MDDTEGDGDSPVYRDPGVSRTPSSSSSKTYWFGDFDSYYRRKMGLPPRDRDEAQDP